MTRIWKLTLVVALFSLIGFGCSEGPDSLTQSTDGRAPGQMATALSIPPGSSLISATLGVYAFSPGYHTVNVHRVTAPWEELTVTYNSFAGAYDPSVEASFVVNSVGWCTADVTALVQTWLDGTYENYGIHLRTTEQAASRFRSSEWYMDRPWLELCYTTPSGPECITIQRGAFGEVADAYITPLSAAWNFGGITSFYTALVGDFEKFALLRFDMEDQPASIGDFVWLDDNNNGIQEPGEAGYPDAEVRLYDCEPIPNLLATTTTDANGYYLFDQLMLGDYRVMFVLPEGYVFSPQDQGMDDAFDSDADQVTGWAVCTTLDPGEHDPTWDAGLFMPEWEGCSLTIGFWKTHAGFGPQADVVTPLLPISLGAIDVTNATEAHDILVQKYCGGSSNGLVKLTAQFLAVMLNGANEADLGAVADEIADAHQYLTDYSCEDWWTGELSKSQKKMINDLKSTFDDYNNGLIGPGHCDDFGDDD